MSEKLEVYDMDSNLVEILDRKKFYDQIKSDFAISGKINTKVKTIRLLLMNSSGRIYLQKRSSLKEENPGLYDKTVGGHVSAGDSFSITVIRECAEELGFPAAIVDPKEFENAVRVTDLHIIGIFKKVDYLPNFQGKRISRDGNFFVQPLMTSMYIGYYDGPIRFVDGESSGIEVFSLAELQHELATHPNKFTEDVTFMIKKYEKFLVPIQA